MYSKVKNEHNFSNPFFIATVTDNVDPNFSYRIKVRIPIIHDSLVNDNLPWAAKVDSSFLGVDGSGIKHSIPEIGTKVLVLAIGNDPNSLVYLGSLYKKDEVTPENKENYINTYGIYTKNGDFIGVDKINNLFKMIWNGDVDINSVTSMHVGVNGPMNLDVTGDITIGSAASEPAVLGIKLNTLLTTLIAQFNTHTHTGNLGLQTSTPSEEMVLTDITSKKITLE